VEGGRYVPVDERGRMGGVGHDGVESRQDIWYAVAGHGREDLAVRGDSVELSIGSMNWKKSVVFSRKPGYDGIVRSRLVVIERERTRRVVTCTRRRLLDMAKGRIEIAIPDNYEFSSIEEAVEEMGGEEMVLEAVRRYFDYASANKKYRENKAEKDRVIKAKLAAAGVSVEELIAAKLKEKGLA